MQDIEEGRTAGCKHPNIVLKFHMVVSLIVSVIICSANCKQGLSPQRRHFLVMSKDRILPRYAMSGDRTTVDLIRLVGRRDIQDRISDGTPEAQYFCHPPEGWRVLRVKRKRGDPS
jgi:hypothetical protein